MSVGTDSSHAALMDATYRHQRLIYDVTRKYYLLGRDRLIEGLSPPEGGSVLEIACGTGRNLEQIARRYPGRRLYGLDISEEMLRSARAKLGDGAHLAQGDACDFDPKTLFGVEAFDRVVLSYSLSMIPDWRAALGMAERCLGPGGQIHIVDFGPMDRLPGWFRAGMTAWLARFHVAPRVTLAEAMDHLAASRRMRSENQRLYRDYAQYGKLTRA